MTTVAERARGHWTAARAVVTRPPGRRSRWWPVPAAVLIAWLTWPVGSLVPGHGLDDSWRIALHMAVSRGVDFGDIAFTYGPLGFLEAPLNAEAHTLLPALAWIALLQVGLAYLIIECARRTLPWPLALGLAYVACRLLDQGREVLPIVAFLWAALVVQWGVPRRLGRILLPLSGVLCATGLLIKVNEGVVALALCAVAAWWLGPGRWRAIGVLLGTTLIAGVVLWLASGNAIGGLGGWIADAVRVASGYSAGLPYEEAGRGWEYPLFIVVVAGIAWFAWASLGELARPRRIGMALAGVVIAWSLLKHGFVRHDLGHSASTFTSLIAVAAGVRWSRGSGRLAGAVVCIGAAAAALVVNGGGPGVGSVLDPSPRAETAWNQLTLALQPGRRRQQRIDAAAALRDLHRLPAPILGELQGRSVHVDPYETSVVWAYGLRWRPLPVFQDYGIYTHALDLANARALRGPGAPERVLRHGGPRIDGHSPEGEGPETLLAMMCGYRQLAADPFWQVLGRASWRCGDERALGGVSTPAGRDVAIPSPPGPDDLVLARVHIPQPPWDRLRTALYKPRELPEVLLDGGYAYRIPASVEGPLMVRAPASLGWAPYAAGFAFSRIRVSYAPSPVRIDFVAIRVTPSTAPASSTSPSRHTSATMKLGRARTSS